MILVIIVSNHLLMSYVRYVTCVSSQDRILLFRQSFRGFLVYYYSAIPFHIGEIALECHLQIQFSEKQNIQKNQKKIQL